MIAFCFAVLTVAGGVMAGYAGSSSDNDLGYGSNSYGYSGSFSGSGPPPNFAIPNFDFSGFLGNYIDTISRYHQDFIRKGGGAISYSYASSSPSASAKAQSSLAYKKRRNRLQSNIPGGYGEPGGFSGGYGGSFGGGSGGAYSGSFSDNGGYYSSAPQVYPESVNFASRGSFGGQNGGAAFSSGSIGPEGIQQTASVYPENPASPNINTRFGAPSGGGGFKSVFTTSESHTSNVDGKPLTVQKAITTVNDNGKITTYTAKNP